jgi:hypothetical protein
MGLLRRTTNALMLISIDHVACCTIPIYEISVVQVPIQDSIGGILSNDFQKNDFHELRPRSSNHEPLHVGDSVT